MYPIRVLRTVIAAALAAVLAACGSPGQPVAIPAGESISDTGSGTSEVVTDTVADLPVAASPVPTQPPLASLDPDDLTPPGTTPRIHADYAVPTGELTDWVAHGDVYATFTISDVYQSPIPREDADRTEGLLIGKTIIASLDEVLWQRQPDTAPPADITFETIGWVLSQGEQQPVLVNSSPDWAVGGHYVGVFSLVEDGWTPLADDAVATVGANGEIDIPTPSAADGANPGPALVFSAGKTPEEVATELGRTTPSAEPTG